MGRFGVAELVEKCLAYVTISVQPEFRLKTFGVPALSISSHGFPDGENIPSRLGHNPRVNGPLCGARRPRRGCPALGRQICPVCCGTKRLVQIDCPRDCSWLASARAHPPAVAVRQQQRDIGLLVQCMRDFSQRQSQLFLLLSTFLSRYQTPELQPIIDDDVTEAAAALAGTFETAARGVIYEHRPASLPAERLVSALKPLLAEAGKGSGSAFERDAAVVLRRLEDAVREIRAPTPENRRAFLELLGRAISDPPPAEPPEPLRLIVP